MHELQQGGDATAWEEAVAKSGVEKRTLVRFARIASFLQKHFPKALEPGSDFVAGSAIILELMKLHQISEVDAKFEADWTFQGQRSVRDLRERVEMYRQTRASMRATPPQSAQQRAAAFIKATVERIRANPSALNLNGLERFESSLVRSPLAPKLVAHCEDRRVAIDIRAPDFKAARSPTAAAAIYCTRIGALMLRYDAVIMLIPESTRQYAPAIFKLLTEWSKEPEALLNHVDIMLVHEHEMTFFKKDLKGNS